MKVKKHWTQAMFEFSKWSEGQIPETINHWQAIKILAGSI